MTISKSDLKDNIILALAEILPPMEADGGGLELLSVENSSATLKLIGTCSYCPSRKLSADALTAELLERVPNLDKVHIDYPDIAVIKQNN